MSLKINVTENRECHTKWNVTQKGMSLKMKCQSQWNIIKNGLPLQMECHSK